MKQLEETLHHIPPGIHMLTVKRNCPGSYRQVCLCPGWNPSSSPRRPESSNGPCLPYIISFPLYCVILSSTQTCCNWPQHNLESLSGPKYVSAMPHLSPPFSSKIPGGFHACCVQSLSCHSQANPLLSGFCSDYSEKFLDLHHLNPTVSSLFSTLFLGARDTLMSLLSLETHFSFWLQVTTFCLLPS